MPLVDLHVHTNHSDGYDPPSVVVKQAFENGVAVLAICDHDNLGGLAEAQAVGQKLGVNIVRGVEISTSFHDRTIHMLGLGVPLNDPEFNGFLKKIFAWRKEGIIRKMEKLSAVFAAAGRGPIDLDGFEKSQGIFFNREKAAKYLVLNGFFTDQEDAFQTLAKTKIEAGFPTSSAEAIAAIQAAGGLAIVAHPFAPGTSLCGLDPTPAGQEKFLQELIAAGLDGLECYHSEYGPEETAFALSLAKKYGLLESAGSDWHGALCDVWGMKDRKIFYPEHIGGLGITTGQVASLLEKLGINDVH